MSGSITIFHTVKHLVTLKWHFCENWPGRVAKCVLLNVIWFWQNIIDGKTTHPPLHRKLSEKMLFCSFQTLTNNTNQIILVFLSSKATPPRTKLFRDLKYLLTSLFALIIRPTLVYLTNTDTSSCLSIRPTTVQRITKSN